MKNWISIKDQLPEENVLVNAKLGRYRIVEKLKRVGNLWFCPDGSLYVWGAPTHYSYD